MDGKLRNMTSVYIISENKMLLLYRSDSSGAAPAWCGISGAFEMDELNDAKKAALREVQKKISLTEKDFVDLSLRYITLRNQDGEIWQNYYFFGDLKENTKVPLECEEGKLEWVKLREVCGREMPFTDHYVLQHYFEEGWNGNFVYCGAASCYDIAFAEMDEF